jgi:hypothetical protein
MRHPALRAAAADVVDAGGGRAPDLGVGSLENVADWIGGVWGYVAHRCRLSSISVVDVEIVELAGRAVAAELLRLGVAFGACQQVGQKFQMLGPHFLLDAIGTEALHLAAHEQPRLVQAVAQRLARIAAARRGCPPAP